MNIIYNSLSSIVHWKAERCFTCSRDYPKYIFVESVFYATTRFVGSNQRFFSDMLYKIV